jgi:hypothetical protein
MILRNTFKYGMIGWIMIATGIYGCASIGAGLTTAMGVASAVSTATSGLSTLDKIYDRLVEAKAIPGKQQVATLGLSIADNAAKTLTAVKAGAQTTDDVLNVAIGQVEGAKAILNQMVN